MKVSLNRILLCTAAALVLVIVIGTGIAFLTHDAVPGKYTRRADPAPQEIDGSAAFDEIGQIRTVTKPVNEKKKGAILVITPWLSYPNGDTAFHEELSSKSRMIKACITGYFSRYTEKELLTNGEDTVKADLLHQINAQLVMGKITAVYFSEYMFLE